MSAVITIQNSNDFNTKEKSYIDEDVSAGASSIIAKSTQGVEQDLYVLIGRQAGEATEMRRVTGISGNTITIDSPLKQDHFQNQDLTFIYCNQIRIYRAPDTVLADGTHAPGMFSQLDTIDIDPDQSDTDYVDASGDGSDWYRFTYYNSTTTAETSTDTSDPVRGGGVYDYCTILDIKQQVGLQSNKWISEAEFARKRLDAQTEIDSALAGMYSVPFSTPNPMIERITYIMAAGFMLQRKYRGVAAMSTANGDKMVKDARDLLAKLQSGDSRLIGENGQSLELPGAIAFQMYPNADSSQLPVDCGGTAPMFDTSDIGGYRTRAY